MLLEAYLEKQRYKLLLYHNKITQEIGLLNFLLSSRFHRFA